MTETIHSRPNQFTPSAVFWMSCWLVLLGVLVYAMILVGGATRLTDSGLSITDWKPISGVIPPLSPEDWDSLFALYRQTAEYRYQNAGMSLSEFEFIYWWEWGHRFLARLVGLVAIAGFVIFAVRGWLRDGLVWKFLALISLGGLQGFIGWWMVASGIGETTRVDVAPYRLMTHFCLALIILCYIYWLAVSLNRKGLTVGHMSYVAHSGLPLLLFGLIFLQMAAGALVAGLDAGRTYTDWPLMAGEMIPGGYWSEALGMRNLFENVATTQFNHRVLAYLICIAVGVLLYLRRKTFREDGVLTLTVLVALQVIWGVVTLIYNAPLSLALIHQGLGVLVMLAALRVVIKSLRPVSDPA